jgi:serine/threonine protein kinase
LSPLIVEFTHSKDIAHRNLKLENILICGLILKLCDFGKAKLLESLGNTQTRVTLQLLKSDRFASPEALRLTAKDEAYVEREMYQKGDIFSLGSVGKAILTEGEILFTLKSGESDSDVIQNILQWDGKDRSKINLDGLEIYPLLKHLILTMVNTDWRKRPTIQQVKMHFALQEEMFWTQVFEAIKEQFLKDIKINPKTNEPANPKLKEAFDPADENKRTPIIGEKSKWTEGRSHD